jgi:hypothetical protein
MARIENYRRNNQTTTIAGDRFEIACSATSRSELSFCAIPLNRLSELLVAKMAQPFTIRSAVRNASAWIVSAGASPPPEEGKTLASATHKLRQRWLRPKASTTEVSESWPIRQVPNTWVAENQSQLE